MADHWLKYCSTNQDTLSTRFENGSRISYVPPLLVHHLVPVTDHIYGLQIMGLYDLDALRITHRDLKPENILVARNGRLLIADFGCASTEPKMWKAHGTRQYRSPEMQNADPEHENAFYDRRADLYALGLLVIEMFRGTVCLVLSLASTPTSFM